MSRSRKRKLSINEQNDTFLLQGIRNGISFVELNQFVKKYTWQDTAAMSTIINNDGELPIDYIDSDKEPALHQYMLDLMISASNIGPLTKPIRSSNAVKQCETSADETLRQNIIIACDLINETRLHLEKSGTHPSLNQHQDEIAVVRSEVNEARDYTSSHSNSHDLIAKSECIKNSRYGNCEEFAILAARIAADKHVQTTVEIAHLLNGDHGFLILGRDQSSNFEDYPQWGKHAVICDPWAGKAFPADQITEKLHDFKSINGYNILVLFNQNVVKIAPVNVAVLDNAKSQNTMATLSLLINSLFKTPNYTAANNNQDAAVKKFYA